MTNQRVGALVAIASALATAACSGASSPASPNDAGGPPSWDAGGSSSEGGDDESDGGEAPSADAGTAAPGDAATDSGTGDADAAASGRQSEVWVWMDYQNSLAAVAAHASSFTHVSPSLYNLNYDYTSGVAQLQGNSGGDSFDGLTSAQIASKIHAAGMKCVPLIQAGAGNSGTDQGIQNILGDSPAGTQAAFISSMVQEAVTKGYDGYSLDWEVGGGTTYAGYGKALVSFLGAFQAALHQHHMQLQLIVGDWYVEQSSCSGGTGVVDLAAVAPKVDQVITMAYEPALGTPAKSCTASVQNPQSCGNDFGSSLDLMCAYVPVDEISIGFDSDPKSGNNDIAGACVSATQAAGIPAVAIWPEYNTAGPNGSYAFCDTTNIAPAGATWFDLLAGFLADK